MQTLEEKFRILADAARDNSVIVVQEQMFLGDAEGFVNAMHVRQDLTELFKEPKVSITLAPGPPAATDEQKYSINLKERDAILAGLRLLQKKMGPHLDSEIIDIMCDNGPGLSDGEIDALCMRLN